MITPSNIAFVISVIKNSRHVWDQTMRMMGLQTEVDGARGKFWDRCSLKAWVERNSKVKWSDEGIKYYKHAEQQWKQLYKNETAMKEMYGWFATWLNKYGRDIIVAKNWQGIKYYKHTEQQWKQLYKKETAMKEMYGGFATWLNKYSRDIIVAKNQQNLCIQWYQCGWHMTKALPIWKLGRTWEWQRGGGWISFW